jgi:hypothetical protein
MNCTTCGGNLTEYLQIWCRSERKAQTFKCDSCERHHYFWKAQSEKENDVLVDSVKFNVIRNERGITGPQLLQEMTLSSELDRELDES